MTDFVVRQITLQDAAAYNAHRRMIADEANNNVVYSRGEYVRSVEEDRDILLAVIAHPDKQILIATAGDDMIGLCSCWGSSGSHTALRHTVGLGIDIHPDWRGKGVGSALMRAMIDWARANPKLQRMELEVFTHNHRAIALYLKCGFEIEGKKRRAYFKYGRFVDAYLMSLLLDPAGESA